MKKSKGLLIGIIAALVLLIGGGAAAAYFFLTNTPKNAYLLSEQESFKSVQDYVSTRFENETKFQEKMKDENYAVNLKLGADVPETLVSQLGVPKSVIDSSNLVLNMAHDSKKKMSNLSITPTIADNKLGEFAWQADEKNQYISAPVLNNVLSIPNNKIVETIDKITGSPTDDTMTNDSLNLNNILGNAQVSQEDINKIVDRYTETLTEKLKDDQFKKDTEKVKIFDEEKNLDKLTMTLQPKEVKEILVAVLEQAKSDKELKDLITQQAKGTDFDKEIDKALKELKDQKETDFPKVVSTIYVDGKKILKRNLVLSKDKGEVKLDALTKIDDNVKVDIKASTDTEPNIFAIAGSSDKKDNNYKDDYKITVNDNGEKEIKFVNESKVDGDKRTDKGTVDLTKLVGQEALLNYTNDMVTDIGNNEQKQKMEISTEVDNEPIKLMIDAVTKLKQDVKVKTEGAKDLSTMSDSEIEDLQKEISEKAGKIFEDVSKDLE
ncbi:flagellar basal body-associated FliL family protein [Macrococcus capreoli]|uniref:DUF6583 family protein n=1 Tax=Macrococcus capreoli TaxID=2982690 RepID=UPI0021D5D4FF|nr:DUF6583 family protein [Macrococcus sp. TMW 2.2395]MCU7556935.1 hypothetical protein [Macrococcus sp. TMW 2.2395]